MALRQEIMGPTTDSTMLVMSMVGTQGIWKLAIGSLVDDAGRRNHHMKWMSPNLAV